MRDTYNTARNPSPSPAALTASDRGMMATRCVRFVRCLRHGCGIALAIALTNAGCADDDTPQAVAAAFWEGMIAQDLETIRRTSTIDTSDTARLQEQPLPVKSVTFGQQDDTGTVIDTQVTLAAEPPVTIAAKTYLRETETGWTVDYQRTAGAVYARSELVQALDELRQLGATIAAGIELGADALEQGLPIIEQEMRKLDRELRDQLPAWQKRLDEFRRRLEDALRKPPADDANDESAEPVPI